MANRSKTATTEAEERFTRRLQRAVGIRQRWMAVAFWLATSALAFTLARPLPPDARAALIFLIPLHGISALMSVRLPAGIYVGLINTSIAAAGLVVGYRHAMLVAPLATIIAAPPVLLLTALRPGLRRYRETVFYESMWQSAAVSIALLPAGWLYHRLGGQPIVGGVPAGGAWPLVAYFLAYFAITITFQLIWIALTQAWPGAYWRQYWVQLGVTKLALPALLAPLIASRFGMPDMARLLWLIPYTLVALATRAVIRTQLHLTERVADLRALNSISQALNANLDPDSLVAAIYREIGKLIDVSGFYLALYDEKSHSLRFALAYEDGQPGPETSREFANGLTEHIIRTRQPVLLTQKVGEQAHALGLAPVGREPKSFVAVPVTAGERVLAVMGLRHYTQEYAYDENDLRLLQTIASSAGVALQNAYLFQQSQRQASELRSLNQISTLISASLDPDTVIQRVCQVVTEVAGCQKSAVFLVDKEAGIYRMAGSVGLSESFRKQSEAIDARTGPRSQVLRADAAVVIEDILTDERMEGLRHLLVAEGIRAVADVPLRIANETIGSLTAYYEAVRCFDASEVELLQTLAAQVSVAVNNARLFERMNARQQELETLYETARTINASLSLPSVLRAVASSMIEALKVETCVTLLTVDNEETLQAELWMERVGDEVVVRPDQAKFALQDLPRVRSAIRSQEHINLGPAEPSGSGPPCALTAYYELVNGLGLPLTLHGDLLGLIVVGNRGPAAELGPDTVRLARALADQAAVAIENARLFERTDVALARRLEELGTLETITQHMTRRLDLQHVIEQMLAGASQATGAEVCELLLLDESRKVLKVIAQHGQPSEAPLSEWPADKGMSGRALQTGETQLSGDVSADPDYIPVYDNIQSELAVPITLEERHLGVLNLESTRPNAFDQAQAHFITSLAEHAAIAIQNAQLFEAVQRRADEFQTLRTIAVELFSAPDLEHALSIIARHALERTGASDIHIYLYDQASDRLTFGTSLWASGEVDREFAQPRPAGLAATAARTGERLVIAKPEEHPLFQDVLTDPAWQPMIAMVSVPLKHGQEVIGVFNVAFEDQTKLNDEMLHFLDLLAAQATAAIRTARLTEQTSLARDRLQAILDSIHDGILMFDMRGRLVLANPCAERLLNLPLADFMGQPFTRIVRHLVGELGEEVFSAREALDLVRQVRANPHATTRRMYTIGKPSPRAIEEVSLAVISDGQPIGRLFILRDITREHEIGTYRQEMSHMIVHDLRSPLAGVITGLNMALDEVSHLEVGARREMLEATIEVALTSANKLLGLVEQILDVNKLEAGEVPLLREPLDLKQAAKQARDAMQGTAAEAGIEIVLDAPDDLPPVNVDADQISRVLVNLLDNALRYAPESSRVTIKIEAAEAHQTVSVIDMGEGVPLELRERIFERFFQGDVSRRKRGAKGSGLGLTFCRLAIEAHGGRIWVDEGPEGGAAFHFTLPVADRP